MLLLFYPRKSYHNPALRESCQACAVLTALQRYLIAKVRNKSERTKKYQTFFNKMHFTRLVEVILWADSLLHEVSKRDNLSRFHFLQLSVGKAVMTEPKRGRKGSFREMALLDRRNGTSQVKKCRFSLNEEMN